jgi:tetratricopeptide (TPR) repeat protein
MAYADATANIGDLRYSQRSERIQHLHAALQAAHRHVARAAEGTFLGNLGIAYAALGEERQAIDLYEQRLVIAKELGDRQGEANSSWNLGLALAEQGEVDQAIALMQVYVEYERALGHPDAEQDAAQVDALRQRQQEHHNAQGRRGA